MRQFNKIRALGRVIKGYFQKWMIDLRFFRPQPLNQRLAETRIIVTLTSYGRRVEKNILYYTLISLLRQSYQPDLIVVWLDKERYNDYNIPQKLKELTKYGVKFNFVEDIRSYKKLIPALEQYPKDVLITVDDDVIYNSDIVESLMEIHKQFPHEIITRQCRFPIVRDNTFLSYNEWVAPNNMPSKIDSIMPIGVSGVLYPPNSLDKEVLNKNIFLKYCPIADDIWFWLMAKKKGTNHKVIAQEKSVGNSFDDLYQYFHKGSALTHTNSKKNANNEQLANVVKYYDLTIEDLRNG